MKEPRWVIRFKEYPYDYKIFKCKWAAKAYLFLFRILHRHIEYSLTYEKIYIKD